MSWGRINNLWAIGFLILISGCATTDLHKQPSRIPPIPSADEEQNPAYELLRSAEAVYAEGVIQNMKRNWDEARADFDEALRLMAQIDAAEDEDLSTLTDLLLREIAYDYRFALVHTDSLEATAAPIVLSAALEGLASTEYTKQRLAELAGELPKALSGEFDFPVVWNDRVKEKIVYFQTDAREPFSEWLNRSGRWVPMINEVFESRGLPTDLAYLPLIESGFAPSAYSWAHAMGMWQFIKSTGRIFGLDVDWWLDERRDPEKATIAAADYFESLYRKFESWELALAAYNCGDGRVKRTIAGQGTDNYWEMDLPTETENYVPLFMAALIIAKDPEAYNFDITYYEPYKYDIISVNEPTNLELIARCTDTTLAFIQTLNPEVLRYCTPPDITAYDVRVPMGRSEGFAKRYASVPESEKTVWARHKVHKGETLSEIAVHYGTSVGMLTQSNKLRSAHRLSIGQELVIPVSPSAAKGLLAASDGMGTNQRRSTASVTKHVVVKKGDTISEIAEKHSVALEDLLLANDLKRGSVIKPGMRLLVPVGKTRTKYTVRSGDSPGTIAARFGVRTDDLLDWNSLSRTSKIFPGQELIVLASESQRSPKGKIVHTVQSGESLWAIARRYDVHVSNLVAWNGLSSSNVTLSVGQKLEIISDSPASYGGYTTNSKKIAYTVKNGDNLGKIASKYDVTVEAIKRWNDKKDTRLQIGDRLVVYTAKSGASDVGRTREITHRVKSGETLSGIAGKYGISTLEIKRLNGKSSDRIVAGETLKIVTASSGAVKDNIFVHSVKPGETLSKIASIYSVSISELREWNGKKGDMLSVGEEVEIHGGSVPRSSSSGTRLVRHTVQPGETMSELAVRYGVKIGEIEEWNEKGTSNLRIGEILEIRTSDGGGGFGTVLSKPSTTTHKIASGETLWAIANKYGTTTDAIINANSHIDPNCLHVGEIIKISLD